MNFTNPNIIHTDRKQFCPVMNGERQLFLSAGSELQAQRKAECYECKSWLLLKAQGWTIESYWESEYL